MSKFYLLNTVKLANNIFRSGSLIDDAQHPKTAIESAGGSLVADSNALVAAAAVKVQAMWKEGKGQAECDAVMMLASDTSHDTASNTTATNQTATTGATVNTGSVAQCGTWGKALPAAGTAVHAQAAGGAALALVAGFTNPLPRRTLNIARSDAGPASVNYTCTVTTPDGGSADIVLAVPRNGNASTNIAGVWSSISTTVDPVSTSDFTTGTGFCVGSLMTGAPLLSVNGVVEAAVSSDTASGTVVPTTAPDGAKEFTVLYNAPHGHGVTDAGHTHVQNAHTHALT